MTIYYANINNSYVATGDGSSRSSAFNWTQFAAASGFLGGASTLPNGTHTIYVEGTRTLVDTTVGPTNGNDSLILTIDATDEEQPWRIIGTGTNSKFETGASGAGQLMPTLKNGIIKVEGTVFLGKNVSSIHNYYNMYIVTTGANTDFVVSVGNNSNKYNIRSFGCTYMSSNPTGGRLNLAWGTYIDCILFNGDTVPTQIFAPDVTHTVITLPSSSLSTNISSNATNQFNWVPATALPSVGTESNTSFLEQTVAPDLSVNDITASASGTFTGYTKGLFGGISRTVSHGIGALWFGALVPTRNEKVISGDLKVNGVVTVGENPTEDQQLVTKEFVTSSTFKNAVKVATTANITLSGLQTIDGILLVADDRVLVKNQTDQKQNGLYLASSGTWTRTTDADTDAKVAYGIVVSISKGSTHADQIWITTSDDIVIGTSNIVFIQFTSASITSISNVGSGSGWFKTIVGSDAQFKSIISASSKLSLVSNTNDITLDVSESNLSLNNIGGTLAANKGGSGFSSYTIGDILYANSSSTLAKLGISTDGYVLTLVSGLPVWAAPGGGGTFVAKTGDTMTGNLTLSGANILADNGVSTLGDSTHRFATLFMSSTINVASGSSLQIGHGTNDLLLHSSGRILINSGTDDGTNQLQVNGASKIFGNFEVTGTSKLNGHVGLGTPSSTQVAVNMLYPASSFGVHAGQYGFYAGTTFSTDATAHMNAIYAEISTQAGSYTTASVRGVRIGDAIKGASHTITEQIGLYVENQTQGVNNFAIKTGLGKVSLGDVVEVESTSISGKTDGTTTLGTSSRRFATLFMASTINIASGSSLQIGHGSNDLVVHSSGRVLVGTGTDDAANKLQINGDARIIDSRLKLDNSSATRHLYTDSSGVFHVSNEVGGADHLSIDTSGKLTTSGTVASGGAITAPGDVTINTSSFVVKVATSRIGIGVASPEQTIDADGRLQLRNSSFKRNLYTDSSGIFHISNEANNADHFSIDTSGKGLIAHFEVTGVATLKGLVENVSSKTANYTLTSTDFTVDFDCTSGNLTATLPATPTTGQIFNVRKNDSSGNQLQLVGNGNNINGTSTKETTTQYYNWTVQFNGTEWMIL